MKRSIFFSGALALGLAACATPNGGSPFGASGVTPAVAVNNCTSLVKVRATSTATGLAEQDKWMERKYPGAIRLNQRSTSCGKTPVEEITFDANGEKRKVLFDISNYFGKVGSDDLDDLLDG